MSHAFANIAFTPDVRAMQARMGSRAGSRSVGDAVVGPDELGPDEAEFIAARDGFYLATVSITGWPYVQFKGGPAGFLTVLGPRTLGYADFRGNVQYISGGNLQGNDKVALILVDYAHRRRLKILGHARLVERADDPGLLARLERPGYRARVERAVIIDVDAFDWNCPQHITPRFTEAEVALATAPLHDEITRLRAQVRALANGPASLRAHAESK